MSIITNGLVQGIAGISGISSQGNNSIAIGKNAGTASFKIKEDYSETAVLNEHPNGDGTVTLMIHTKHGALHKIDMDKDAVKKLIESAEVAGLRQTLLDT